MFDNNSKMGVKYKLDILLRPRGKCDLGYLSGFADCIAATLKRDFGALDRRFEKTPQNILIIHLQINSDIGAEEDVCQFLVDVVETSSMNQEDLELFVDGRRITLVDEK